MAYSKPISSLTVEMWQGVIPIFYVMPGDVDVVIGLLNELVPEPEDRKRLLLDWCNYVGLKFVGDFALRVGIKRG